MAKSKFVVQVPRGVLPCQVDDFPKDCERSVKGSLRVSPGVLELTEGELKHIRKHHKDLGRRFVVVREPAQVKKAASKATASSPDSSESGEESAPVEAPKSKSSKGKSGKGK